MSTTLATRDAAATALEQVVMVGDLAKLTAEQRLEHVKRVCDSLGLNPLTRPFEYITLSGKLTLYARKDCTEQLRRLQGVSIVKLDKERTDDLYIVTATAQNKDGRTDVSTGALSLAGLKGEALANAIMKCETKAKRRVTLSICGLGCLDESELDTTDAAPVYVENTASKPEPAKSLPPAPPPAPPAPLPDVPQDAVPQLLRLATLSKQLNPALVQGDAPMEWAWKLVVARAIAASTKPDARFVETLANGVEGKLAEKELKAKELVTA